jgi:hypothetical protein
MQSKAHVVESYPQIREILKIINTIIDKPIIPLNNSSINLMITKKHPNLIRVFSTMKPNDELNFSASMLDEWHEV